MKPLTTGGQNVDLAHYRPTLIKTISIYHNVHFTEISDQNTRYFIDRRWSIKSNFVLVFNYQQAIWHKAVLYIVILSDTI